jgi:hypothetical protein
MSAADPVLEDEIFEDGEEFNRNIFDIFEWIITKNYIYNKITISMEGSFI